MATRAVGTSHRVALLLGRMTNLVGVTSAAVALGVLEQGIEPLGPPAPLVEWPPGPPGRHPVTGAA